MADNQHVSLLHYAQILLFFGNFELLEKMIICKDVSLLRLMKQMKIFGKPVLNLKRNKMECALCKVGTTEKGMVIITLERHGAIVLIKDVPAEVCTNCGHYCLSEEITRIVMEKGNTAIENGAELEVFKLHVA